MINAYGYSYDWCFIDTRIIHVQVNVLDLRRKRQASIDSAHALDAAERATEAQLVVEDVKNEFSRLPALNLEDGLSDNYSRPGTKHTSTKPILIVTESARSSMNTTTKSPVLMPFVTPGVQPHSHIPAPPSKTLPHTVGIP